MLRESWIHESVLEPACPHAVLIDALVLTEPGKEVTTRNQDGTGAKPV